MFEPERVNDQIAAIVDAVIAKLHQKAIAQRVQLAAAVKAKRAEEREGVAWALQNKTSYSDSAWKDRHRAEVRLGAATAFVEAIDEARAEARR